VALYQPVAALTPAASTAAKCALSADMLKYASIHVPRTKTVYGSRAFSVAAPALWNRLPADITNTTSLTVFRNCLKTFLFHLF